MLVPRNRLLLWKNTCAFWWWQNVPSPLSNSGDSSLSSDLRPPGPFDKLKQKWNNWEVIEIILSGPANTLCSENYGLWILLYRSYGTLVASSVNSTWNSAWHVVGTQQISTSGSSHKPSQRCWLIASPFATALDLQGTEQCADPAVYPSTLSLSQGSWLSPRLPVGSQVIVLHIFLALWLSVPSPGNTLSRVMFWVAIVVRWSWWNTVTLGVLISCILTSLIKYLFPLLNKVRTS